MRRFSASADTAVSTTPSTNSYPLELVTGAGATAQIYDLLIGNDGATPVDAACIAALAVATAATVGSAVTPTPLDPNGGASITTSNSNPTAVTLATTLPAALWSVAFNARVTVRWAAIDPDSVIHMKAGLTTATGTMLLNQQPSNVAGITLRNTLFFKE